MRIAQRKESPIIGLTGMGGGLASYILYGGSGSSVYEISRSLRFNSEDTAYLSRNVSSAGNQTTWTWSGWLKRSKTGSAHALFGAGPSGSDDSLIMINGSDQIEIWNYSGSYLTHKITSAVFRDPSAFYHIVVSCDGSTYLKIYVNGVEQALSTDTGPDGSSWHFNGTGAHNIGRHITGRYLDGYLADVHFIDGQALSPSDFGETDEYGIWNPKLYTGTHGTNGFHLKFDDTSSNAALGTDSAGSNDWTVNNLVADAPYSSTSSGMTQPELMFDNDTTTSPTLTADGTVYTMLTGVSIPCTSLRINANANDFQVSVNGGTFTTATNVNSTWLTLTAPAGGTLTSLTFKSSAGGGYGVRALEVNGSNLVDSGTSAIDSLLDSPTNYSATSGNNGGNYATLNPLSTGVDASLSNGNLVWDKTGTSVYGLSLGTIAVSSGKWYCEVTVTSTGAQSVGVTPAARSVYENDSYLQSVTGGYGYASSSGQVNGVNYGDAFTDGDTIGIALDLDNGKLFFNKNGTFQNSGDPASGINPAASNLTGTYTFGCNSNGRSTVTSNTWNFGQRPFAYTPPTGYLSLCTQNLSTPAVLKGSEQMDIKLYEGNGTSQTITGLEFSPDFIWIKNRDAADEHHAVFDTVRGKYNVLYPSIQNSEANQTNGLTSFTSDGWSVGTDGKVNKDTNNTVGWAWNAGDNSNRTYNVTVVDDGGNKYRFNGHGTSAVTLELEEGSTYVFDSSDSSVDSHPFVIGTSANSNEYSTGVTYTLDGTDVTYSAYTSGFAAATTRKLTITVPASAPTLYYWCYVHSGMGGQINTNETAGSSVLSGSLNSSSYDQSQTWSTTYSGEAIRTGQNVTSCFDGSTSTEAESNNVSGGNVGDVIGTITFGTAINVSSKVEFYVVGTNGYRAVVLTDDDGNSTSAVDTVNGQFVTVNHTGTFKSFSIVYGSNSSGVNVSFRVSAVRVDGKILVDSGVTPPAVPSLNSVVRANPTAGFSIVSYTGGGTAGNIAHGLNAVPEMIMVKNRDDGDNGAIYHVGTDTTAPENYFMTLFALTADGNNARSDTGSVWNDTAPTSSVFSVGTEVNVNNSTERYIAYCFAPVEGYSAFGSYTGNGLADGPFVYTGMAPKFILFKRSDGDGDNWTIFDTERDSVILNIGLQPNIYAEEQTFGNRSFEVKSNGFKVTSTGTSSNGTGQTYIWAAFAEHPLKNARAV